MKFLIILLSLSLLISGNNLKARGWCGKKDFSFGCYKRIPDRYLNELDITWKEWYTNKEGYSFFIDINNLEKRYGTDKDDTIALEFYSLTNYPDSSGSRVTFVAFDCKSLEYFIGSSLGFDEPFAKIYDGNMSHGHSSGWHRIDNVDKLKTLKQLCDL